MEKLMELVGWVLWGGRVGSGLVRASSGMVALVQTCWSACDCMFGFTKLDVHQFESQHFSITENICHIATFVVVTGTKVINSV
jgi:hypothetical protein